MTQPFKKYMFRPIEGIWRNISGESEILADVLNRYGIHISCASIKIDLEVWTLK